MECRHPYLLLSVSERAGMRGKRRERQKEKKGGGRREEGDEKEKEMSGKEEERKKRGGEGREIGRERLQYNVQAPSLPCQTYLHKVTHRSSSPSPHHTAMYLAV